MPLFAVLVSLGVLVAHAIILRRARRFSLDAAVANRMAAALVAGGFLGAHFGKFLYQPQLLAAHPLLPFHTTIGISSFGGVLGGLGAALVFRWHSGLSAPAAARYLDLAGYAFPFGWVFGRAGCAAVHDHPGLRANGWFTHAFPDGRRYDLGLIEMVAFALPVAALFLWLGRRPRRGNFFSATFLALFGLFRLALDRLHDSPPAYGGLTVDQIGAFIMLALSAALWYSAYGDKA